MTFTTRVIHTAIRPVTTVANAPRCQVIVPTRWYSKPTHNEDKIGPKSSEHSTSGSEDDIAHSDAAYDGDITDPETAKEKMGSKMDWSAAEDKVSKQESDTRSAKSDQDKASHIKVQDKKDKLSDEKTQPNQAEKFEETIGKRQDENDHKKRALGGGNK